MMDRGATSANFGALLVLAGAAVAAWGSARASPAIWAVSLACLAAAAAPRWAIRLSVTPLAIAVWAYAAWTILHTVFLSRAYNPAGLFDPLFLLAGFTIARALPPAERGRCYGAVAALAALLAAWAVGQVAFGAVRGHAHLETGNTLAAVLNLALGSAVVAILYGARSRRLEMLTAMLFAGMLATLSRGGAIALVLGLAMVVWVGGRGGICRERLLRLSVLFAAGAACTGAAFVASNWLPRFAGDAPFYPGLDSMKARFELFDLAWSMTTFGWGIGYLAFRYVLEVGRAQVPSYGESSWTYFVHNDYLQILLELGVPGAIVLVAIFGLAIRFGARVARAGGADRIESLAMMAGVSTVAIHALVDFPLHIVLCLLLLGFCLGVIDRLNRSTDDEVSAGQTLRLGSLVLTIGLTVLLARPVIAEAAAAYGMKKWLLGQPRDAAYGFEIASRSDPRDWRYQLYAGQFWFAQAAAHQLPEHAKRADNAFAAGMVANPLEPSSGLGRAFTHLRYASILPAPASPATIRAWAEQAIMVAPLNPAVRGEYDEIVRRVQGQQ